MSSKISILFVVILMISLVGCSEAEEEAAPVEEAEQETEPTAEEQVIALEAMCAGAADAMAARQAEATLYDRIGGRDGIREMLTDAAARHQINDQISRFMEGVDVENLIDHVTDFLVVSAGGEGEYTGRDLVEVHEPMELSDMDFLATGADMGAAMDVAGWGEGEKQEVLCSFVALRGEVVTQ